MAGQRVDGRAGDERLDEDHPVPAEQGAHERLDAADVGDREHQGEAVVGTQRVGVVDAAAPRRRRWRRSAARAWAWTRCPRWRRSSAPRARRRPAATSPGRPSAGRGRAPGRPRGRAGRSSAAMAAWSKPRNSWGTTSSAVPVRSATWAISRSRCTGSIGTCSAPKRDKAPARTSASSHVGSCQPTTVPRVTGGRPSPPACRAAATSSQRAWKAAKVRLAVALVDGEQGVGRRGGPLLDQAPQGVQVLVSGLAAGQQDVGVVGEVELGARAAERHGDDVGLVRVARPLEGAPHLAGGGEPVVLLHAAGADVHGPPQGHGGLGGVGVEALAAEPQEPRAQAHAGERLRPLDGAAVHRPLEERTAVHAALDAAPAVPVEVDHRAVVLADGRPAVDLTPRVGGAHAGEVEGVGAVQPGVGGPADGGGVG